MTRSVLEQALINGNDSAHDQADIKENAHGLPQDWPWAYVEEGVDLSYPFGGQAHLIYIH